MKTSTSKYKIQCTLHNNRCDIIEAISELVSIIKILRKYIENQNASASKYVKYKISKSLKFNSIF